MAVRRGAASRPTSSSSGGGRPRSAAAASSGSTPRSAGSAPRKRAATAPQSKPPASSTGKIQVAVRCRPFSSAELSRDEAGVVQCGAGSSAVQVASDEGQHEFNFSHAFGPESNSQQVFDMIALPLVEQLFDGFNGTIFAYGQTGSGKTHSMMGNHEDPGVIPLVAVDVFRRAAELLASLGSEAKVAVKASYIQIYNEKVQDLLGDDQQADHKIRSHPRQGTYVEGLTVRHLDDAQALMDLIGEGNSKRAVASTQMNAASSRSHVVVLLTMEQEHPANEAEGRGKRVIYSKMNLVDLAGSERAAKTGATGATFQEAIAINQSLSALGNVINALSGGQGKGAIHIPFRSSKLTHLLEESLGGNSNTVMLAAISPAGSNLHETIQTLQYASRAKLIVTNAKANDTSEAAKEVAPPAFGAEEAEAMHMELAAKLEAAQNDAAAMLREQLEQLRGELGDGGAAREQQQRLEAELAEVRSQLREAERARAEAQARRDEVEARAAEAADASHTAVREMRSELAALVESQRAAEAKRDEEAKARRTEAEEGAGASAAAVREMHEALSALMERQRALIEEAIETTAAEGSSKVAAVAESLAALKAGVAELQAEQKASASQNKELHATTATEASRRIASLAEERGALRKRCEEGDAQLAEAREELAKLRTEADGLREALVQRDGRLDELLAGHESHQEARQTAETRSAVERSQLHDERRVLEQSLADERQRANAAEAALARKEALLARLMGAVSRPASPSALIALEEQAEREAAREAAHEEEMVVIEPQQGEIGRFDKGNEVASASRTDERQKQRPPSSSVSPPRRVSFSGDGSPAEQPSAPRSGMMLVGGGASGALTIAEPVVGMLRRTLGTFYQSTTRSTVKHLLD